jgi:hypothetical protein
MWKINIMMTLFYFLLRNTQGAGEISKQRGRKRTIKHMTKKFIRKYIYVH